MTFVVTITGKRGNLGTGPLQSWILGIRDTGLLPHISGWISGLLVGADLSSFPRVQVMQARLVIFSEHCLMAVFGKGARPPERQPVARVTQT